MLVSVIHLYIAAHKLIKRGCPYMECCHTLCHWCSGVYHSVSATEITFVANCCAVNVKVVIIFICCKII